MNTVDAAAKATTNIVDTLAAEIRSAVRATFNSRAATVYQHAEAALEDGDEVKRAEDKYLAGAYTARRLILSQAHGLRAEWMRGAAQGSNASEFRVAYLVAVLMSALDEADRQNGGAR